MKYQYHQLIPSFLILIMSIVVCNSILGQSRYTYNDGPYIFDEDDNLRIQWIENGAIKDSLVSKSEAGVFNRPSLPVIDLNDLDFEVDNEVKYTDIDKVVAVSDVHGQYDILIALLKAHEVIDENLKWKYGEGHLMVIGDNFDRGDKVMDILWYLFYLQKEAKEKGGKVHVLLGNHEMMVLNGDLRYLHKKYLYTQGGLKTRYDGLFRKGSILGDWIASHKALTTINDNLFVHAGISPAVADLDLSFVEINKIFNDHILRQQDSIILKDSIHSLLYMDESPLWYRGYFDTTFLAEANAQYVLDKIDVKRIIIGHTSLPAISSMFDSLVLDIDCSIKLGKGGQVLIMEDDQYFIGDMDGHRDLIKFPPPTVKKSLFQYLYAMEGRPRIMLNTDIGQLIKKSDEEEYQVSSFVFADSSGKELFSMDGRIRARGKMRKKVCRIPPVKVDFSKSDLDALGFLKLDKLKMVFPCHDRDSDQEMLLKERLLYDIYGTIDTNGIRIKMIDFVIMDGDEEKYNFIGCIVEDEEEYARRKNAVIIENGRVNDRVLDRESFLKMDFFQYMIANTDWSIANKHNLELVKLPDRERVVALPYDFDYAGFVGQRYAVPHESLPIESVHDRYFFSYKVSESEFKYMVEYYLSMEDEIYKVIDQATYLQPKTINKCKEYLKDYFNELRRPDRLKSKVVKD